MINETELRRLLVTAFDHLKVQHEKLSVLEAEIGALRETLRGAGLSGTFQKHFRKQRAASAGVERAVAGIYDDIIRQVKSREFLR